MSPRIQLSALTQQVCSAWKTPSHLSKWHSNASETQPRSRGIISSSWQVSVGGGAVTVAKDRRKACQVSPVVPLVWGCGRVSPSHFFSPLFKYTVCSLTHLLQGMLSISAYLYNPLCLPARQWTCPDWSIHISPKERHVCPQHDPPEYRCCILSPHPVEERYMVPWGPQGLTESGVQLFQCISTSAFISPGC